MEQIKAAELGSKRISSLLTEYAIPAIIAMTASSLYNMVDSIFIGHGVGALAISGLAITFPLMNLAAAFGSLVGVGGSTLLSVRLGQKDYETSQKILGNVFILNLIVGLVLTIVTLAFLDPILLFFGASEATLPYAHDYMYTIVLGNVVTHMYFGLNAMLRSSGHPRQAMVTTILTVVVNTLLDPLFIYGFGWGIKGAAIATVLAQMISLIWLLIVFTNKNELIHFKRGIYRLNGKLVGNIIGIGLSPFLMNVASCFIVILINNGLKRYDGDLAIGAFGIVNRIVFVFIMIVMGLNQGMQPIAGFNFGARYYHRVNEVLKLTIFAATAVTTIGFTLAELMPRTLVSAFTTDETLIDLASHGLQIVMICFPIVGFQMVTSNFFQSINMANKSILLSLSRQVIIMIPCLIILPMFMGSRGVWISMPIADFISVMVAGTLLVRQFREFKRRSAATN